MSACEMLDRELRAQTGETLAAWAARHGVAPEDLVRSLASGGEETTPDAAHDLAAAVGVPARALRSWIAGLARAS